MAWWDRFRRSRERGSERGFRDRMDDFVASGRGVEMYLEPATRLSLPSAVLVAHDGRWARFTVPDLGAARSYAKSRNLPCYDAGVVGYPRRMRDYDRRRKEAPPA